MKLDVVLAEPTQPRGPFITYGHTDTLAYGLADAFAHKRADSWTDAFADAGAHGVHGVPVG